MNTMHNNILFISREDSLHYVKYMLLPQYPSIRFGNLTEIKSV